MPGTWIRAGSDPTPQWPETGPTGTHVIHEARIHGLAVSAPQHDILGY